MKLNNLAATSAIESPLRNGYTVGPAIFVYNGFMVGFLLACTSLEPLLLFVARILLVTLGLPLFSLTRWAPNIPNFFVQPIALYCCFLRAYLSNDFSPIDLATDGDWPSENRVDIVENSLLFLSFAIRSLLC